MKRKTISSIISKKIESWISSIDDESLKKDLWKNTIVTGGCIASLLLREKVNDFDIYFRNIDITERIAKYYVARFQAKKSSGIECGIGVVREDSRVFVVVQSAGVASEAGSDRPYQYFESTAEGEGGKYLDEVMSDPESASDDPIDIAIKAEELRAKAEGSLPSYRPVFISSNAITLSDGVQVVLRFHGEPEEIHKNYDFVHCTNYWSSWDNKLTLHADAMESLLAKELRYVGSLYPLCSLFRIRKFIKRGWTISAGQMLKICMQLNAMDLTKVEVLREQLTGVDVAYFTELLNKIHDDDPSKINYAYIIEIIDRMF